MKADWEHVVAIRERLEAKTNVIQETMSPFEKNMVAIQERMEANQEAM
jgi:hypothetical protein